MIYLGFDRSLLKEPLPNLIYLEGLEITKRVVRYHILGFCVLLFSDWWWCEMPLLVDAMDDSPKPSLTPVLERRVDVRSQSCYCAMLGFVFLVASVAC